MWRLLSDTGTLPWYGQLGLAAPFALALAFVGKWLLARLDALEKTKDDLVQQVIHDVIPTLSDAAKALTDATQALHDFEDERRRPGKRT